MNNKFFNVVDKHPIWVISVFLLLAIAAADGAKKLIFKGDYRVFFGPENPQLIAYEAMQNIYSKNDNVNFVVVPPDGNVFTAEHLKALKQLTRESWQIPYSTRVDSITNFQHSFADEDNMVVEDLVMDPDSLSERDLSRIKRIALNEPLLVNKIISAKGDVSVVNVTVRFPEINPITEVPEVAASARAIRDKFLADNPGSQVYLSGMVMMNTAFSESSMNDSAKLTPLMFLVVIVIIGLLLRTLSGTIATVIVLKMSTATTMGLAGWLGFYVTSPSALAPTMILTLAVADCVHILTTMFYEMRHGADKRSAITKSLQLNVKPIAITSITTAIGFLCMNFSDSPPYRDLGNLVAIGVMLAFVFSLTIFPALLRILPVRVSVNKENQPNSMEKLADFVINKRKILLPAVSLVIVIFAINLPKNELNDDYVKYFDHSVPFRVATDFMQENISGMTILEVSVESGVANGINHPDYLNAVARLSDWLRQQPETDNVNTITDTLKRINKNMHGDDPGWYKLPDNQEMAAQYLLLYEMSLPYGLDLNNQIDVNKSSSKLVATFKNLTTNQMMELEQRINNWFSENASEYNVVIASPSLMFAHIGERSIKSLLVGAITALLLISVLLGIALKSWRYGFVSLIPNLLPITVGFGVWGLIDGQIGIALAVVAGMTLGIVVDDTVHFLSKYLHARRYKDASPVVAVHYAFGNVGSALWITTLVLVAGFTVLAQSSFKTNADMGLLTAITLCIALVIDFLFLPPLLMAMDKNKDKEAADQTGLEVERSNEIKFSPEQTAG